MTNPRIAFVPGDANGIGPELTAKVLASPPPGAEVVLIGDGNIIRQGERVSGKKIKCTEVTLERLSAQARQEGVLFLPFGEDMQVGINPGHVCADAGKKSLAELSFAAGLAQRGLADGVCFAPLNKEAMKKGGMTTADELHHIADALSYRGHVCEINIMDSGLWTSRVTSHVALRDVADLISVERIVASALLLERDLKRARAKPKIAVAALNPHGGDGGNFGTEEIDIIAPAVEELRGRGMDAVGPYPADTLFRRAAAENIHGVVTMYHDQGQIALKLNGFERGVSVLGGLPVAIATPAHGTAFDIAGKNQAFTSATEHALQILIGMALPNGAAQ